MANTTCPPLCDNSAFQHYELMDLLAVMYDEGSYPTCLCPPELFMRIVEINYIRAQQAMANLVADGSQPMTPLSLTSMASVPSLLSDNSSPDISLMPTPPQLYSDEEVATVIADGNVATIAPTDHQMPTCGPVFNLDDTLESPLRQDLLLLTPAAIQNDIPVRAHTLLKDILAYSPEESAARFGTYIAERLILGRLWQSTLVIYLIASLQPLGALRSSSFPRGQLRGIRAVHGTRLYEQLRLAVDSPGLKKSLLWPLVVCGFDAACETGSGLVTAAERRKFVRERLPLLGQDVGTSLPEYARMALTKFWDSGRTDWDSCFDAGYAFVT